MKTFGIFMIVEFISIIICAKFMTGFSQEGRFIIGMLMGWFCYKLWKEESNV